jgi:signal peptidase I
MQPRPKIRLHGFFREMVDTLVFVLAIFVLVEMATPRFMVEGRSMQPNFADYQRLIVSRLNYLFGEPSRGDIIIFNAPGSDSNNPPLIKRVIGLPGETVEIRDTQVYIDGVMLEEPYINEACRESTCPDEVWELGDGEYFFMGDNRNNSRDSRRFGPVTHEQIIGEALIRYWPPEDWGIVLHIGFPE